MRGCVEVNTLEKYEDVDNTINEADVIAEQIEEMVATKNLKYKDIIILIRNRTHLSDIEDSLIKKSIPVTTDKKESLLNNLEIQDLFYLLKYLILDEHNQYELFLLLKSPIFNFKVEDIQKINVKEFKALEKFLLNKTLFSLSFFKISPFNLVSSLAINTASIDLFFNPIISLS